MAEACTMVSQRLVASCMISIVGLLKDRQTKTQQYSSCSVYVLVLEHTLINIKLTRNMKISLKSRKNVQN